MIEHWKPVVGYENRYEVSDFGNVRITHNSKLRKTELSRWGYTSVRLYKNKIQLNTPVHRLVCSAFIGQCPPRHEVDHINGIKTDNRLSNLEYVTRSENHKRAFGLGLRHNNMPILKGINHGRAKLTEEDVHFIRASHRIIPAIKMAVRFNVSKPTIDAIIYKRNWRHI